MRIARKNLWQKAVLWAYSGVDKYGQPEGGSPVEIRARYEESYAETGAPESNSASGDIEVFVDRDIAVGSQMWLGKLANLPSPVTNTRTVVEVKKTPSIRGRDVERIVVLSKVGNDAAPNLSS